MKPMIGYFTKMTQSGLKQPFILQQFYYRLFEKSQMHRWNLFYHGSRRRLLFYSSSLQVCNLISHLFELDLNFYHFRANMYCNRKKGTCLPKKVPGQDCEKNTECFQSLCLEPQRQPEHRAFQGRSR